MVADFRFAATCCRVSCCAARRFPISSLTSPLSRKIGVSGDVPLRTAIDRPASPEPMLARAAPFALPICLPRHFNDLASSCTFPACLPARRRRRLEEIDISILYAGQLGKSLDRICGGLFCPGAARIWAALFNCTYVQTVVIDDRLAQRYSQHDLNHDAATPTYEKGNSIETE